MFLTILVMIFLKRPIDSPLPGTLELAAIFRAAVCLPHETSSIPKPTDPSEGRLLRNGNSGVLANVNHLIHVPGKFFATTDC